MRIILFGFLVSGFFLLLPAHAETIRRPKIIFDTDIGGDADDLAALAMLHTFKSRGQCELLAVMCWSDEQYAVPAIDAINRFYKHSDIPIGVRKGSASQIDWFYNKAVADRFPYTKTRDDVPDATRLYRELLAQADDNSVIILTVGPLKNIQDLINSKPDGISPLTGTQLIKAKVKKFVIMGGRFPEGKNEWNFNGNRPGVTKFVVEHLETPVVFLGYEVGVQIKTGKELIRYKDTPLYVGYSYFGQHAPYVTRPAEGEIINNSSFDQTAVLYAVLGGTGEYWDKVTGGYCAVEMNGDSRWVEGKDTHHAYLMLKAEPQKMADLIFSIMVNQPEDDRRNPKHESLNPKQN